MYNDASLALIPSAVGDGVVYNARPVEVLGAELVTGLTNGTTYPFDTFTSSGRDVTAAIKTSGFAGCITNGVTFTSGDKVRVRLTYNKTSGNDLRVLFSSSQSGAGVSVSDTQNISESGEVYCTFTMTATGTAYLQLGTGNASHSIDAAMLNISVKEVLTSAQDFDFTRASEATRVLSGGRIEKVRTNSLLQSNQFDTTWTQNGVSVTGNQTGYNGSDAWLLEVNSASGSLRQVISSSGVVSLSFYAKAGTADYIRLRFDATTQVNIWFDLGDGSVGTNTNGIVGSIEDIGSGWYRVTAVANTSSLTQIRVYPTPADAVGGDSGDNIYIQDAQLEQGLVATEYIATTSTSVSVGSVNDMPRLDWSGGCPALLLEPSRTNLVTYSEDFSQWGNARTSETLNAAISPSGLTDATLLEQQSGQTNAGSIYLSISLPSSDYTQSIFAKKKDKDYIVCYSANAERSYFNLSEGTIGTVASGNSAKIEDYGNGWYRCSITYTAASGAVIGFYLSDTDNSSTVTDSGGIYIWGAQLEAASYETSYIPSYGTATTRAAGACLKTGVSSLINSVEGTLYFESSALTDDLSSTVAFSISDGTATNAVRMGYQQGADVFFAESSGTSNNIGIYSVAVSVTSRNKFALRYKENDAKLYINGSVAASDTVFTAFAAATFNRIAFDKGDGTLDFLGNVNQVLYFPTALSDTELEKLTTL